jgi:hypothetical protein
MRTREKRLLLRLVRRRLVLPLKKQPRLRQRLTRLRQRLPKKSAVPMPLQQRPPLLRPHPHLVVVPPSRHPLLGAAAPVPRPSPPSSCQKPHLPQDGHGIQSPAYSIILVDLVVRVDRQSWLPLEALTEHLPCPCLCLHLHLHLLAHRRQEQQALQRGGRAQPRLGRPRLRHQRKTSWLGFD